MVGTGSLRHCAPSRLGVPSGSCDHPQNECTGALQHVGRDLIRTGVIVKDERISELLTELNRALHTAGDFDEETRELLKHLNEDIDRLTGESGSSAIDRAKQLESRFAANHPIAERIARELADVLAKMGI